MTKNLKDTLKLINTAFTLNKNVKKNAYSEETFDCCGRCGMEEDPKFPCRPCPEHDWKDCYFSTTIVDYNLRNSEYRQKTKLLITIINNIKKYNLPIKYGKNRDVIYFEYSGIQCSFHDSKNVVHCKPFPGRWTKKRNFKIPYSFVN